MLQGGSGELHAQAEEAGEHVGRLRKRENEREGVKVEDNNFGGVFYIFIPRGAMSKGMDLSGTT